MNIALKTSGTKPFLWLIAALVERLLCRGGQPKTAYEEPAQRHFNASRLAFFAGLMLGLLSLTACGPSEKQKAEAAELKRIECLDKFCEGDVQPPYDWEKEATLKINGQWFVGPREYFSSTGSAGFEWWERKPLRPSEARPLEAQKLAIDGKGYDFSIEIFLGTPKVASSTMYQQLQDAKRTTTVLESKVLRPGLEMWRTQEKGLFVETWYVATNLQEPDGDPPTIVCRGGDPKQYRCSTGFMWKPSLAASIRFRATHGPDWPEIYQETQRVLNLLKKV